MIFKFYNFDYLSGDEIHRQCYSVIRFLVEREIRSSIEDRIWIKIRNNLHN